MAEIKYIGIDDLDLDQGLRLELESDVIKHAQRIERMVKNDLELIVHLKPYHKTGERQKISVHIRANYPGGTVISDKQHDWQLLQAVQAGMLAIEHQIEHKLA